MNSIIEKSKDNIIKEIEDLCKKDIINNLKYTIYNDVETLCKLYNIKPIKIEYTIINIKRFSYTKLTEELSKKQNNRKTIHIISFIDMEFKRSADRIVETIIYSFRSINKYNIVTIFPKLNCSEDIYKIRKLFRIEDILKPRICYICGKSLKFEEYISGINHELKEKLYYYYEKIWFSNYIELFCCYCHENRRNEFTTSKNLGN
jgi:hypothetical protein